MGARPAPSVIALVASGLLNNITGPLSELASAPAVIARRLRTPRELLGFGGGLASSARRLTTRSVSSLNGPIGPHRRWTSTTASLTEVKEIRRATGSTVNDVLLAATTRGFRDLLEARGELEDGLVVRSLVPVSVRAEAEHGAMTNRVSSVLVNLPVSEPDPLHRLALLHGQMDAIKRTHQAVGAEFLTEMLGFAAPTLLALGTRAGFRLPQILVQTLTTNVPGPRFPLFILGRQMVAAYPYAPIAYNVQIAIAIFSYLDRFFFGITAELGAAPDLDVLIEGIGQGVTELREPSTGATPAHVSWILLQDLMRRSTPAPDLPGPSAAETP